MIDVVRARFFAWLAQSLHKPGTLELNSTHACNVETSKLTSTEFHI